MNHGQPVTVLCPSAEVHLTHTVVVFKGRDMGHFGDMVGMYGGGKMCSVIVSEMFRRGLGPGTLATGTSLCALSDQVVKASSSLDFLLPQRGNIVTAAPLIRTESSCESF